MEWPETVRTDRLLLRPPAESDANAIFGKSPIQRVLEKLGMTREGVLRRWIIHPNVSDEPRDSYCDARVRPTATS